MQCPVKLPRCCGEGMLRCEREEGHYPETPHAAELVEWG